VADITSAIRRLLEDMSTDAIEERVVEYVIREVRNGRRLEEVLADPFVRNRLSAEKVNAVLERPGVMDAVEQQISTAFQTKDFGFSDS
jgi:hypothetical protein